MTSTETGLGIEAKSDAIYELVEEGSKVERVATGFTFTEGPIWHPKEHYLLFSDMPGDVRRKYTPDGTVVEVKNFSNKGNGMTYDADLNLLVCEHTTSCLVRESPSGEREIIAQQFEGEELNSPNDVCVHSNGAIYFSDPTYGRVPVFGLSCGSSSKRGTSARARASACSKSSTRKNSSRPLPGCARSGLVRVGCSCSPHWWRQSSTVPSASRICPK